MKSIIRIALAAMFALAAALVARSPAHATDVLTFTTSCSNTNSANVMAAGPQLFVQVSEGPGVNEVTFRFTNTGDSSITDVYFDDGTLLGIASISDSGAGVAFDDPASPASLPSQGNCPTPFVTTAGFSADSDPPVSQNGVDASTEWLDITFNLQGGQTFDDVIAALKSGELRIGMHVQSINCAVGCDDGSETFVNDSSTAVSLSSVGATARRGQVTLNWSTGSEVNIAGFNLFRATSLSGQRVKVNDRLIAAQGNQASGSSYSAVDAPGYGSFYYWVEDVDLTGLSTLHAPVQVNVRAPMQRPLYRPALPGARW